MSLGCPRLVSDLPILHLVVHLSLLLKYLLILLLYCSQMLLQGVWEVGRASLPTAAELIIHCAVCLWCSMRVDGCRLEGEKISNFYFYFVIYASMFTH